MVSVIVAAYNASRYLEQCLNGIIDQSYRDIEIIAVDDGSTDTTVEIMRAFAEKDSRISVFSQENRGVSAARNLGISKAKGEFITFTDADDWTEPEHIKRLVSGISDEESDCCVSGYILDFPDGSSQIIELKTEVINRHRAVEDMLSPDKFQGFLWNKLFKTSTIRKNHLRLDEDLFYMEDLAFCAEYFKHCRKITCIPYCGCHYRQHENSMTCKKGTLDANFLKKRETAIKALYKVGECCHTKKAARLCKARIQTEYAEMLRSVSGKSENDAKFKQYRREIRRGLSDVLTAPLSLKQKIKHTGTALFPKSFSRYLDKRQSDRFRRR